MASVPSESGADEPQARTIVLYYDQAACIREHVGRYLDFVDGPTLIFPGFCRDQKFDPSPSEVAAATSRNAFGQSTILFRGTIDGVPVEIPTNERATALVMTGDQIRCLGEKFMDVIDEQDIQGPNDTTVTLAAFHYDRC